MQLDNPSPASEHRTLVISATIEEPDIQLIPHSTQTAQIERDAVAGVCLAQHAYGVVH
jgi:hypothetical protein